MAEAAGQVVGFAAYSRFRDKPGYGMTVEHSIYVAEPAQRLGAGRALMDALLARARAAGVHAMVGVIDADNAASVTFHEHLGFRNEGVLHEVGRKFGRWLNVAFLVLLLDEPQPEV